MTIFSANINNHQQFFDFLPFPFSLLESNSNWSDWPPPLPPPPTPEKTNLKNIILIRIKHPFPCSPMKIFTNLSSLEFGKNVDAVLFRIKRYWKFTVFNHRAWSKIAWHFKNIQKINFFTKPLIPFEGVNFCL